MTTWTLKRARAVWASRQCLTRRADTAREAAVRGGWPRTLGGVEAYLALAARCASVTVAGVHDAVLAGELRVTPAVRGCIYLVPRDHAPLALAVSEEQARPRLHKDLAKAGASVEEAAAVADAVVEALAGGPLTTDALRRALPDGVVRSLGDAGKKAGVTTTLPPALRLAEWDGRVERFLPGGRVDTERYLWRRAGGRAPTPEGPPLHAELARVFLSQAGPATVDELAAWSGLTKTQAKAAIAATKAAPVRIEGHGDAWVMPEDLDAPVEGGAEARLLPMEDVALVWRGGAAALTDPAHHGVPIERWGRGSGTTIGDVAHPMSRLLMVGDTVVGLWEWDGAGDRVVWRCFAQAPAAAVEAEAARVAGMLRELGHGRTFSLDTDADVARRAASLGQPVPD